MRTTACSYHTDAYATAQATPQATAQFHVFGLHHCPTVSMGHHLLLAGDGTRLPHWKTTQQARPGPRKGSWVGILSVVASRSRFSQAQNGYRRHSLASPRFYPRWLSLRAGGCLCLRCREKTYQNLCEVLNRLSRAHAAGALTPSKFCDTLCMRHTPIVPHAPFSTHLCSTFASSRFAPH